MSLTLLEKQGTIQYPRSGALLNYHALGRQSGRLFGCNLVQATSETIVLTSGVLVVRGYRIEVINETVFDATQAIPPAEPMRYYIIIRLDAGSEDTEMELIVTDEAPINDIPIEQQSGLYDYVIGVFNFGPGGISELSCLIETIKERTLKPAETDGVVWFDGTAVDGTEEPIFCVLEEVPDVDIGDYYLNHSSGNYYKCSSISNDFAFWEWKGSLRGPEGPQGPEGSVDLSNYYTKAEIDNLLASMTAGASDELSLVEGILTIDSITSSTMTFIDGTLTIE